MLVYADGRTIGTIGGGCYENDAFWKARETLKSRKPVNVKYELSDDFAEESGLICGGQMEVFIEPLEPAPDIWVFGAGHVGAHLVRMAHDTGFKVHVLDDREKFANSELFPDGVEVHVEDISTWLNAHPLPHTAYAVIVTRGHRHDLDTLRALVTQDLAYVGLIGSRAKVKRIFNVLLAENVAQDALRAIHAPIGLNIGAITPQEIAVAILAELIAVRRGKLTDPSLSPASLRWPGALAGP
jgi:xanthine dehydrogenase accessory factor